MCGIFVYLGRRFSVEKLKPHFQKIQHRGPEFSKIISICPGVVFGFHRLAIIDSTERGHQPIYYPDDPEQVIVVNGEIYNYRTLKEVYDYHTRSDSDSDVMLHLYHHFGVESMVRELDGVFAFVIRDHDKIIAGNDIIGVRPLFVAYLPEGELAFASEEKALFGLGPQRIERFKPGTFIVHDIGTPCEQLEYNPFFDWNNGPERLDLAPLKFADERVICSTIEEYLIQAVKKRLVSDRPVGCLLSGGLDSSLVTSIVSRYYGGAGSLTETGSANARVYHSTHCLHYGRHLADKSHANGSPTFRNGDTSSHRGSKGEIEISPVPAYENDDNLYDDATPIVCHDSFSKSGHRSPLGDSEAGCTCSRQPHLATLHTFSVGMKADDEHSKSQSPDLKFARMVADKLGTTHHEIEFTFDEAFRSIREVIWCLGSADCTTVRASIGQFLLAKYVRERTDVKVLLSGEGAEETFGSYSYLKMAPDPEAFNDEVIDLCRNLYQFDGLRADRTLAYFGLELREPFLDLKLFPYVLFRIPPHMRMHGEATRIEKYLLRKAFEPGDYLPAPVLWRKKEAFSDGVAYTFRDRLIARIDGLITDSEFQTRAPAMAQPVPLIKEAYYYRKIYDELFPNHPPLVTKHWMPRADWFPPGQRDIKDPSARVLPTYDITPETPCGGSYATRPPA